MDTPDARDLGDAGRLVRIVKRLPLRLMREVATALARDSRLNPGGRSPDEILSDLTALTPEGVVSLGRARIGALLSRCDDYRISDPRSQIWGGGRPGTMIAKARVESIEEAKRVVATLLELDRTEEA